MTAALDALRERLGELADLHALGRLASWDQRTMMPPAGGPARALQLATLERLTHERATDARIGDWLDECEAAQDAALGELERDVVRLARRDWERTRKVPVDLAAEIARAQAEGQTVWQAAREADDFAAFVPALRHNVELARAYADAVAEDGQSRYDALLADYDYGLQAERVRAIFERLAGELTPLVQQAARRPPRPALTVPEKVQRQAVTGALKQVGVDEHGWRVDESAHPFTSWIGSRDVRLTTRYDDGNLESVLAALHEFGHGLYERQIPAELMRTSLGRGTSMSAHESQSKLWENHVGRHRAFAGVIAAHLRTAGFDIAPDTLHAALTDVRPSLIRVSADPASFPLHIVVRFELELALIDGTLDIPDLPSAWNEAMHGRLGIRVPNDRLGVLQDIHWAAGAFGYFPSYALGSLIAAQLWEALERDLGAQDGALAAGEVTAIKDWLADRVHRHGRRLDTEPLVEAATGAPLAPDAFLLYIARLVR